MRTFSFFQVIICAFFQCTQRVYDAPPENQKVEILDGDTSKTFPINKVEKKIKIPKDTKVYWFKSNRLYGTKGGYNGPLVHGEYTAMVSGSYLLEKGNFVLGLKDGEWLRWHPNGEVHSVYHWVKGKREGVYSIHNINGSLKETGKYRNDKLNGKVIIYDADRNKNIIKYRNGEKIDKVEKQGDGQLNPGS